MKTTSSPGPAGMGLSKPQRQCEAEEFGVAFVVVEPKYLNGFFQCAGASSVAVIGDLVQVAALHRR